MLVLRNSEIRRRYYKIPAGLQAYLDKKKGKKGNGDKKEEENGNGNGNGSKGSKPDFLDLDKDGDKKNL